MKGVLYLIPTLLGPAQPQESIPTGVTEVLDKVDVFLAEKLKTGRRSLRAMGFTKAFDTVEMHELNKHTETEDQLTYVQWAASGKTIGILSEAGCPGVADPGADLVKLAHEFGVKVIPLVGPSSILLALMGSGLNGQSFAFVGYVPRDAKERSVALAKLEKTSKQLNQTQLFIETPYRNHALLETLLKTCRPDTYLTIAANLTLPDAFQETHTIQEWKTRKVNIQKKPAVFGLLSA